MKPYIPADEDVRAMREANIVLGTRALRKIGWSDAEILSLWQSWDDHLLCDECGLGHTD